MDALSHSPSREINQTYVAPKENLALTSIKVKNLIATRRKSEPKVFTFDPSSLPIPDRRRGSLPLQNRQNPLRRSNGIFDLALALRENQEAKTKN